MDVLETKPGSATPGGVAGPLAPQPAGSAAFKPAVAPVAGPSPSSFGGNPTGRAPGSRFKHPAGTPEGIAERKEWDAQRKQAARAAASKLVQPAPLPSALPSAPGPVPPASAVQPGSAGDPASAPVVPWQPDTLTSLVEELLNAAEESRVESFLAKCAEAKLTGKLIEEIERDVHFPKAAKALLKQSLPRLAAKWLNKAGVSAEYQDELAVVTAILLIVQNDRKMHAKLDELVAASKPQKEEKKQ